MQNRSIWWVFCLWSCHCTRDVVVLRLCWHWRLWKYHKNPLQFPTHSLLYMHFNTDVNIPLSCLNDHSRGTLKGPEARSGTAPQIPAPADRSFQQMMVNETQRRPAWRCGLEPLEVKHSYRLFQSFSCAFMCIERILIQDTRAPNTANTEKHKHVVLSIYSVWTTVKYHL